MPVTARRSSTHAVSQLSSTSTRPTGRSLAKHRKTSKPIAPRAAAAVLSVGMAVGGGAALSVVSAPAQAEAATTKTVPRGQWTVKSKPLLRFRDRGPTVSYVQKKLRLGPDGYFGTSTVRVLVKFQKSWGLKATGTMTEPSWGALHYAARHGVLYGPKGKTAAKGSTSTFRAKVLREAAKLKGTPYRYGGTTPRGFDCSGFTGYVYKKAGKKLQRTSRAQYAKAKKISRKSAKPGDLIFFKNGGGSVYHVGIFAGGNMLWHASKPGVPVKKGKIWSSRVAFGRA